MYFALRMLSGFLIDGYVNDSICQTISHKIFRILHWGPLMSLFIIFFVSLTSLYCVINDLVFCDLSNIILQFFGICFCVYNILKFYLKSIFIGPGFVPYGWKPVSYIDIIYLWIHY